MHQERERAQDRLKSRGSIDDNWDQTLRLFERLKGTGLCRKRSFDDVEEWTKVEGVTFLLDEEEGTIRIFDYESEWDGNIGFWTSEAGFFVLCMENNRRPFHKLRSIADAVAVSVQISKLDLKNRKRCHPRMRDSYL